MRCWCRDGTKRATRKECRIVELVDDKCHLRSAYEHAARNSKRFYR